MRDSIEWAAGLFEGEGSFSIRKDIRGERIYRYLRLQLDSTDKDIVYRFRDAVEVGRVYGGDGGYTTSGTNKPVWKWLCAGSTAWVLARSLQPFLGIRRRARLDEISKELLPTCMI